MLPLVTLMFTASTPLVVMLDKLHCKLGEKQGSVQSSVAEVVETVSFTLKIALTATK